ncbi:MAG: hypothetical protein ABL936_01410 [Aestuariivirga sp.]
MDTTLPIKAAKSNFDELWIGLQLRKSEWPPGKNWRLVTLQEAGFTGYSFRWQILEHMRPQEMARDDGIWPDMENFDKIIGDHKIICIERWQGAVPGHGLRRSTERPVSGRVRVKGNSHESIELAEIRSHQRLEMSKCCFRPKPGHVVATPMKLQCYGQAPAAVAKAIAARNESDAAAHFKGARFRMLIYPIVA